MAMVAVDDPMSYEEAMESAERKEWKCAMKKESDDTKENYRCTPVKLPLGKEAIPYMMIFKRKLDGHGQIGHCKASLVAKGYV